MKGGFQLAHLEPSGHIDDRALVPRYEVDVSGGSGLLAVSECVEDRIGFSRAWLTRHQINAASAGLVRVKGDSMAPTVPDGALVLIDTSQARLEREGIYVFSRDGEAFVKRLVPVAPGPGGVPTSVVIISDGGTFPPEFVTGPPLNDIRVTGRVRCIIATL